MISPRKRHGRRGAVLVLVLWLVVVLTVIAYSLAYEMRVSLKMTAHGQRKMHAQALAQAGLARAVCDLRNDRLIAAAQKRNNNTLIDVWANTEDKTEVELGKGTYTVRIVDEESKININTLQQPGVPALKYLLEEVCDVDKKDAETVAYALIDFKDPDLMASDGQGTDEVEHYTDFGLKKYGRVMAEDWTFRPKNDNYLTMEELMEVPGITSEVLYGDEKVPRDPIDRIDYLAESKRPSTALADYVTVLNSGQININTCPVVVIEAALAAASGGLADMSSAAKRIDKVRQERLKMKSEQGYGITDLQQFAQANIDPKLIGELSGKFPVGLISNYFTIVSRGEYQGVRATVQALVRIDMEPYNLNPDEKRHMSRVELESMGSLKSQPLLVLDPAVRVIRMSEL